MNLMTDLLRPWQWGLMAAIPPLIVLLYFLKLKREPLEVPSTYLWSRTVEDLHVNSIWQRLRRNLLLFLQLLLIALAILACLNPNWRGSQLEKDRAIFMVDNSASMSATDVNGGSRLAEAKRQVELLIDEMKSGTSGMIIAFSDAEGARTIQSYTDNRRELKRKLATIQPTHRRTDLRKALRFASGLANPGRNAYDENDEAAADAMPAHLFILSDGRVAKKPEFSMGNLDPAYIRIGSPTANNLGIVAFQSLRNPERPEELEVFARVKNYGVKDASIQLSLFLDDKNIDAAQVDVAAGAEAGTSFSMPAVDAGVLSLKIDNDDDLAIDNEAFAVLESTQRARILLVTEGNMFLETAFTTEQVKAHADVKQTKPEYLATDEYKAEAADGTYDLVIFDQCAPETAQLQPQANTIYFGQLPPGEKWKSAARVSGPRVIDTEQSHPLMHFMAMNNVLIGDALAMEPPNAATTLVDSDLGPVMAIATRDSVQDLVISFSLLGRAPDGSEYFNTTWVRNDPSFPVFIQNALGYLGGVSNQTNQQIHQPGQLMQLRLDTPSKTLTITTPAGKQQDVGRGRTGAFTFSGSDQIGVYQLRDPARADHVHRVAVNLFDETESNIVPVEDLEIDENVKLASTRGVERVRRDMWKWLALAALVVLMVEWYIYNRRVYL